MKQNYLIFLLVYLLVSCTTEHLDNILQEDSAQVTFSFNSLASGPQSKSKAHADNPDYYRLIAEVYAVGQEQNLTLKETKKLSFTGLSESLSLSFQLQKGQPYRILFWSDLSKADISDVYYVTNTEDGLRRINSIFDGSTYNSKPQNRDAFFAAIDYNSEEDDSNVKVTLTRACGVLKIDTKDLAGSHILNKPVLAKTTLAVPQSFNVHNGTTSADVENVEVSYTITDYTETSEVFSFYMPTSPSSVLADFTTTFFATVDNNILTKTFSNIPIVQNAKTILTGHLFTTNASLDVSFGTDFSDGTTPGEVVDKIIVQHAANSFILNPGTIKRQYSIPISHQNIYWQENDAAKVIDEGANWKSKVIWQESATQISLKNTVTQPMHFDVIVYPGAKGNALIGVYNDQNRNNMQDFGEEYLWSYHLWVTDYNPDQEITISSGVYDYPVSGGKVQRIAGNLWNTSDYAASRLMDRNLGEISSEYMPGYEGCLFYQYGRKDPFPKNLIGSVIKTNVGIISTMKNAINNPDHLYSKNEGTDAAKDYRWSSELTTSGYLWSDLKTKTKSIFDPCPHGWMIPKSTDFKDMLANGSGKADNSYVYNNIAFRKYLINGAVSLTQSKNDHALYTLDIAGDSSKANSLYLNPNIVQAMHRSTGIPVRCIKHN